MQAPELHTGSMQAIRELRRVGGAPMGRGSGRPVVREAVALFADYDDLVSAIEELELRVSTGCRSS